MHPENIKSKPREDSSPRQPIRHTCADPAGELIEEHCAACENLSLDQWVRERYENCLRLAETKSGLDRDGWLNDADYFRRIAAELRDSPSRPSPDARLPQIRKLLREYLDKAPVSSAELSIRHLVGKALVIVEDWEGEHSEPVK